MQSIIYKLRRGTQQRSNFLMCYTTPTQPIHPPPGLAKVRNRPDTVEVESSQVEAEMRTLKLHLHFEQLWRQSQREERMKRGQSMRAEQLFIEIGIPIASAYLLDLILCPTTTTSLSRFYSFDSHSFVFAFVPRLCLCRPADWIREWANNARANWTLTLLSLSPTVLPLSMPDCTHLFFEL